MLRMSQIEKTKYRADQQNERDKNNTRSTPEAVYRSAGILARRPVTERCNRHHGILLCVVIAGRVSPANGVRRTRPDAGARSLRPWYSKIKAVQ